MSKTYTYFCHNGIFDFYNKERLDIDIDFLYQIAPLSQIKVGDKIKFRTFNGINNITFIIKTIYFDGATLIKQKPWYDKILDYLNKLWGQR